MAGDLLLGLKFVRLEILSTLFIDFFMTSWGIKVKINQVGILIYQAWPIVRVSNQRIINCEVRVTLF